VIRDVTGIEKIRMLYLQLLYRRNFECGTFCFHGERLSHKDAYSPAEAIDLLELVHRDYGTEAVTLLGGEPFLYRQLPEVIAHAKQKLGMRVEICTNGYRIERRIRDLAGQIDLLRVSMEGLSQTNDELRKKGSFDAALRTLAAARDLGVPTGVTMTVNARNVSEVVPLACVLETYGVRQLKLHCLRLVGFAADHPELAITDTHAYERLRRQLESTTFAMEMVIDEDLSADPAPMASSPTAGSVVLDRIEADPRGALTMSCKAVGKDAHAFWYDKQRRIIEHRPTNGDEITLPVPNVVYSRV
jgi:MoaA/NifB/PqqE/SkfB family radical SAM enzyme